MNSLVYFPQLLNQCERLISNPNVTFLASALGATSKLHLVGGAIRNLALDLPTRDLDFATILTPQEVFKACQKAKISVYSTGLAHGTVTANIGGENYEITTFRQPGNRESEIFSKEIAIDLAGRDFTLNAVAYDLANKQIIDPFEGLKDLANKMLKAVTDPKIRFAEDPLRVLRMIRIAAEVEVDIDPETFNVAKNYLLELRRVSPERIRVELEKILLTNRTRIAFNQMLELGVLAEILPEMLPAVGFEQNDFHHEDVYNHLLSVVEQSAPELKVRLAALFHDFGKPHTLTIGEDGRRHFFNHEKISTELCIKIMERLRFSKNMVRSVSRIVAFHMRPLSCGAAGARRLIRDLEDDFEDWFKHKQADYSAKFDIEEFQDGQKKFLEIIEVEKQRQASPVYGNLAINGDDLISLGVLPGKEIGRILSIIKEELMDNPDLNQRDILLNKAKELISSNQ